MNIFNAVKQYNNLPTIPAIAVKLIELLEEPCVSPEELLPIIKNDPAISAKLLQAANSSCYNLVGQVDSLRRAAALLGVKKTIQIALTFSLYQSINQTRYPQELDCDYFWKRSIVSATVARTLSQVLGNEDSEIMFLAGLFQDIGILAIATTSQDRYLNAIRGHQYDHFALTRAEFKEFRIDHSDVGAWLLNEWNLPTKITTAISSSHDVSSKIETFTKPVVASGYLADYWICDDLQQTQYEIVAKGVLVRLFNEPLSRLDDFFGQVSRSVEDQLPELAALFNVESIQNASTDFIDQISTRSERLIKEISKS